MEADHIAAGGRGAQRHQPHHQGAEGAIAWQEEDQEHQTQWQPHQECAWMFDIKNLMLSIFNVLHYQIEIKLGTIGDLGLSRDAAILPGEYNDKPDDFEIAPSDDLIHP